MLHIHVICVGKLKEKWLSDAVSEYSKRLGAYCSLTITELEECRAPERPAPADLERVLQTEGKRILAAIPKKGTVCALCIEGGQISSEELSRAMDDWAVQGVSDLCFVIGGSWGLSDEVKQAAARRLSMSKMTFPHQLARVMLLEQLYRAFQISTGGKYHK